MYILFVLENLGGGGFGQKRCTESVFCVCGGAVRPSWVFGAWFPLGILDHQFKFAVYKLFIMGDKQFSMNDIVYNGTSTKEECYQERKVLYQKYTTLMQSTVHLMANKSMLA